ncbi:MAG TPA: GNAT family N-acetyltransferase [Ohtaekwangia sp.]|uniref:GNAT family N-acetyltransferase n=1 Tax=Ohtaekwangia sp. TaxID=2066019 RepID=UPI002F930049
MISIRNAGIADISIIQDLAEKTWWPTYSSLLTDEQIRFMLDAIYSHDALKKVMEEGSQQFLLLADEQGDQGFASYGPRKEDPAIYKLHKLYVLPNNQGKGYGRLLIDEVTNRIKQHNGYTLELNVKRDNPAITFYEKMGFTKLREEDIPIGPYWMKDFVMRKKG